MDILDRMPTKLKERIISLIISSYRDHFDYFEFAQELESTSIFYENNFFEDVIPGFMDYVTSIVKECEPCLSERSYNYLNILQFIFDAYLAGKKYFCRMESEDYKKLISALDESHSI